MVLPVEGESDRGRVVVEGARETLKRMFNVEELRF